MWASMTQGIGPVNQLRLGSGAPSTKRKVRWKVPRASPSARNAGRGIEGGAWAAYHAGRSVRRAYRETKAPEWLRNVLKRISTICLSWAARSLDLPRWNGLHWSEIQEMRNQ